ncbi:hypothetical protein DH2020_016833 [Rehmannia glutinosa]|uniref:Uncharacterized protein n=1 Tax=Rehmannia glutinosa TaxID=99300 RepID=A0ABR0WP21_REHGL
MATQKFHDATGKMSHLCRKIIHVNIRWSIVEKVTVLRRFIRFIWERILVCSVRMPNSRYRRLSTTTNNSFSPSTETMESGEHHGTTSGYQTDSDLVSLKITILGDCEIGKTTFVIKYVGAEEEKRSLQMKGLNLMDKTLHIRGARIAFRIWDVGGDNRSLDQVPIACKDAVAIFFIIIGWYSEARKWNQTAIPILIGTKFDDFVQLPPDIQWTVVTQVILHYIGARFCLGDE